MSAVTKSIEFAIENYHQILPQASNLIPFPNYKNLEERVQHLTSLASIGKTDLKEATIILNAFKFLDTQINRNSLYYTVIDFVEEKEYYSCFHHKMIRYTLDAPSLLRLNHLTSQFLSTFHLPQEQNINMHCNHRQKHVDTSHDHSIQRIKLQFAYEIPRNNTLVVVIDTSYTASFAHDNAHSYNVYINHDEAKKWKSLGVPIGPRKMTLSAMKLQLLAKETLDNGEIVIHPLHREIPTPIATRILIIIKSGRPFPNFHCGDFVRFVHLDYRTKTYAKFVSEKELSPGDALCLTDKPLTDKDINLPNFLDEHFIHYAIYAGKNVYLSLYGTRGPIRAASLQAMQMCYNDYKDIIVIKGQKQP